MNNLKRKKTIIFIDFECINNKFSSQIQKNYKIKQIPFAYTIGSVELNEVKFNCVDFSLFRENDNKNLIYFIKDFLKINILKDIRKLISNPNLNYNEVKFVGWNPDMENKIINDFIFINSKKETKVFNLIDIMFPKHKPKRNISLSFLSNKSSEFKHKEYWSYFRGEINKNLSEDNVKNHRFNSQDGSIASFAGVKLFNNYHKFLKGNYNFSINIELLINELKEYSQDDIKRMFYIKNHQKEIEKVIINLEKYDKNKHKINEMNTILKYLNNINPNKKLKDIIKNINQEINKLKKENDEIEK